MLNQRQAERLVRAWETSGSVKEAAEELRWSRRRVLRGVWELWQDGVKLSRMFIVITRRVTVQIHNYEQGKVRYWELVPGQRVRVLAYDGEDTFLFNAGWAELPPNAWVPPGQV